MQGMAVTDLPELAYSHFLRRPLEDGTHGGFFQEKQIRCKSCLMTEGYY